MSIVDAECHSTSAPMTQASEAGSVRQSLLSLSSADYQDYSVPIHQNIRPKSASPLGKSGSLSGSFNNSSSNKYGNHKKSLLSRAVGTKEPSLEALDELRHRTFADVKDATDAAIKLKVSLMKLPPEAPSPTSKEPEPPRKKASGGKRHEDSAENLARIQRFGSSDTFGKDVSRSSMLTTRNTQRASSILTQQYSIDENSPFIYVDSQATTAIPSSAGSNGEEPTSLTEVFETEEARDSVEYRSSEDSIEFSIRDSPILNENSLTPRGANNTKVYQIDQTVEDDIPAPLAPPEDVGSVTPSASLPLQEQPSSTGIKNVISPTTFRLQQGEEPDLQHKPEITRDSPEGIPPKRQRKKSSCKVANLLQIFRKKPELHE